MSEATKRRPNRDRLSAGELEGIAVLAEQIATDYAQQPSDARRQVRRLAQALAELARHMQHVKS